ncbi:BQ5605_C011g06635 [Microbotryum silenes-dioicae]|uniref:BQ5605_C011g06635 protein n=1 Tax=Microbotryum silenes-dioicae TaxID=796604 RepID=A0A2X0MAQ1_9BASI|nr:BQ5605_C011g06635 [Microbotryum silenes-dioicae]
MTPACFSIFVKKVLLQTEIVPSEHVTVEEKLAMLLYWLRGAESYRKIVEVFQSDLRKLYVVQPTADTPTSSVITDKARFARYFGNCIGAIDGTHAPCTQRPTMPNDRSIEKETRHKTYSRL